MKKIYFLTILAVLFGTTSLWANTAKIEQSEFEGNRKWHSDDHVSFEVAGDGTGTTTFGGDGRKLTISANTEVTVKWTVASGCTINVTKINCKFGNAGTSSYDIYFDDQKISSCKGWNKVDNVGLSNLSLGNDGTIRIKTTRDANIYYIDMTYTITPSNAPAVANTEETINVTLDANNLTANAPQTVTFATNDHFAESLEFDVTPNSGFAHNKGVFYATVAGTYTAKARVAAVNNCHEASAWSNEVTITVNRLDQSLSWENEAAIHTNMIIGSTQNIAAVATSGRTVTYETSDENILKVDADGKLTAVAEGEATITASRAEDDQYNAAESITKTFKVRLKGTPHFEPNEFTSLDSCAIHINEVKTITLHDVSEESTGKFTITPADDKISVVREGNTITITPVDFGETTLTLAQEETEELNALSTTYKITVLRLANAITVNNEAALAAILMPGQTLAVAFASNNTELDAESFVVEQLEGTEFAKLENGIIVTNYREGTASWKVSQPQSDNFEAAEAIFSAEVKRAAEATDCYVLVEPNQHSIGAYDNKEGLEYTLTGPGETLYVKLGKFSGLATDNIDIYGYRADGSEAFQKGYSAGSLSTDGNDKVIDITTDVTKIKFIAGGTLAKWFSNVYVTRKIYLNANAEVINVLPGEEGNATLNVDYSLANGGDLQIACDNEKFALESTKIANVDCKSGKVSIPVRFTAPDEESNDTANIILYNGVYNKTLQIVALTRKITPEISWNIAEMTYMEERDLAATVNAELELNYEVTEGEAIVIEEGKLKAVKAGEAKVRVFTEATTKYNEAELVLDIKVNKAAQTINWTATPDTIDMDEVLILAATATCGEAVTFESSDNTIAEVNAENRLVINGTGTITITAKQAGTDNYLEAEEVRTLVIVNPEIVTPPADENKKDQVLTFFTWLAEVIQGWFDDIFSPLLEGEENYVVASSGNALTFESSNPEIVNVVTDEDGTVRLQALQEGEVTITVTQEGDDEWNPVVESRKITVKPKSTPTGCDNVEDGQKAAKILRNGQILIIRDGKVYTVSGMRVE